MHHFRRWDYLRFCLACRSPFRASLLVAVRDRIFPFIITMAKQNLTRIKSKLSCPHCWKEFPTVQLLFISESQDLPPDTKLPSDRLRFLPQRFNLAGAALDPHNIPCEKLACPECHLPIPRPWLESAQYCRHSISPRYNYDRYIGFMDLGCYRRDFRQD